MAGTIKSAVAVSLALVLTGAILFAVLRGGDGLIRKSSPASGAFTEVVVHVDEQSLVAGIAALSHGVLGSPLHPHRKTSTRSAHSDNTR